MRFYDALDAVPSIVTNYGGGRSRDGGPTLVVMPLGCVPTAHTWFEDAVMRKAVERESDGSRVGGVRRDWSRDGAVVVGACARWCA